MKLLDIFPESRLLMDLKARDKKGVIREMIQFLVDVGGVSEEASKKLDKAVNKRESQGSTGMGKGLAIPHAKDCAFLDGMVAVFGRSRGGVEFNSLDGEHVHLAFMVASSPEESENHLSVVRKIATMHRDEKTLKFLATTDSISSVLEILKEIDDSSN
jgi:mannitol/fructose-specific phosphotransferase system IIA component (Ntr-type)